MNVKMPMLSRKKNKTQSDKYKLEKTRRKYTNILTVGNGMMGDSLFYT